MKFFKTIFFSFFSVILAAIAISSCTPIAHTKDTTTTTYTPSLRDSAQIFIVGKTVFGVVIKDNNGSAIPGLTLKVTPEMTMASGMSHGTPVESIVDNGDGSYTVTAYFLMDSSGGTWQLHFHVNGTHLSNQIPITVGGSMMSRGQLKGIADLITPDSSMPMTTGPRPYFIFKSALDTSGASGSHTIDLFLAAREDMMTHVAVYSGQTLTNEMSKAWTTGTILLSVCNTWNGTACTAWSDLTDKGTGHFTGTGLTIADTSATPGTTMPRFVVHLNVVNTTAASNEWKTTGGVPGAGDGTGPTEFSNINQ
ncbi:MAG: FixH family protein [Spirochaetia bacterium]|nr:FixH family protein [Spirochaetia bacterium]